MMEFWWLRDKLRLCLRGFSESCQRPLALSQRSYFYGALQLPEKAALNFGCPQVKLDISSASQYYQSQCPLSFYYIQCPGP